MTLSQWCILKNEEKSNVVWFKKKLRAFIVRVIVAREVESDWYKSKVIHHFTMHQEYFANRTELKGTYLKAL